MSRRFGFLWVGLALDPCRLIEQMPKPIFSRMKSDQIDPAELDAYDAWVAEHLDEMAGQHPGKVIAVYQDRLIAVGNTYREVLNVAKARGIAEPFTMRMPTTDKARAVFPSVFPSDGE